MENITNRITPSNITELAPNEIFVFGSNLQGLHAGGAARFAMKLGAKWGKGVGIQGQTYAIPTLDAPGGMGGRLSVNAIGGYVKKFVHYAKKHPELTFLVTEIGCGIAGFSVDQIAPLFSVAIPYENICLPERFWAKLIGEHECVNYIEGHDGETVWLNGEKTVREIQAKRLAKIIAESIEKELKKLK